MMSEHTLNDLLNVWVMGILISIVLSLHQYFKWPLILESVEKKKDLAPGSNQVARSTSLTAPDSNNMESFLRSLADNKTQSVSQPLNSGISETIALFSINITFWKNFLLQRFSRNVIQSRAKVYKLLLNKPYGNGLTLGDKNFLKNNASLLNQRYVLKSFRSFQRGTVSLCWLKGYKVAVPQTLRTIYSHMHLLCGGPRGRLFLACNFAAFWPIETNSTSLKRSWPYGSILKIGFFS